MADLHDLTALEQAAAIARGELTSAELVEHYLDRVGGATATRVGAFVTVTAGPAPAQAAAPPTRRRARTAGRCTACRPRSRT